MELICKLLEEAVKQFRTGTVAEGDKALNVAIGLRKEIEKAKKLVPEMKPESKP